MHAALLAAKPAGGGGIGLTLAQLLTLLGYATLSDGLRVDFSGDTSITVLELNYDPSLTSIDVDGCTGLTSLNLAQCTALATLDVSSNAALAYLEVGETALTSLDVVRNC